MGPIEHSENKILILFEGQVVPGVPQASIQKTYPPSPLAKVPHKNSMIETWSMVYISQEKPTRKN